MSADTHVKNPVALWEVSLIVTTAAEGLATVKSSWALIAVKILSAVVLLLVSVLNSFVPAVPVVEVKTTFIEQHHLKDVLSRLRHSLIFDK